MDDNSQRFELPRQDRGDLVALLGMLRRRVAIIVFALLICAGAAYALSASRDDRFRSTSELLFKPLYLDAQLTGLALQAPGDAARDAETNVRLVDTGAVHARVAARIGGGFTASDIGDDVAVTPAGASSLVDITAESGDPAAAKTIADTMATEFVAYRREMILEVIRRAQDRVEGQLAVAEGGLARKSLRVGLRKLELLEASGSQDVQIASFGSVPKSPFSPNPMAAGLIGGLVGLVVGLGLALLADQLDRRLRRPEQLARDLSLPILSEIPQSKVLRRGEGWFKGLPGQEAEAFRTLRANLRYSGSGDVRSVLVTSASAESGKTTVALHLAIAAAGAGSRVLLLEADMRRPRLHELLGLPQEAGLSTILQDPSMDLEGAGSYTTTWSHAHEANGNNGNGNGAGPQQLQGSLQVLLAGSPPSNPSELLDSDQMHALVRSLTERFDLVIVDGPPMSIVSDALPLATKVDGVVLVTRLHRESRDEIEELRAQLARLDVRVFGAVANFARARASAYYTSTT